MLLATLLLSGLASRAKADPAAEATPTTPETTPSTTPEPADDWLEFDTPAQVPAPALDGARVELLKTRRQLLDAHQLVGLGLIAAQAGSVVTGQLSYQDKFVSGDNSGRWTLSHKLFVYPTVALGAAAGTLAFLTPAVTDEAMKGRSDSAWIHKIGEYTALAGWVTQVGLGLYSSMREGYGDQQAIAVAHLVAGYVSLAGMAVGLWPVLF